MLGVYVTVITLGFYMGPGDGTQTLHLPAAPQPIAHTVLRLYRVPLFSVVPSGGTGGLGGLCFPHVGPRIELRLSHLAPDALTD